MKKILLPILLLLILYACKTNKNIPRTSEPTEILDTISETIEKDTIFLITQKGDPLTSLDKEVSLPIYRLLPDTVTIAAVGDIMTGTNFPDKSYLPKENGSHLWSQVTEILGDADITFGNLEGTILNEGGDQKECNNPKLCYLFRSPEYLSENFVKAGFDLMSVANNHANDFGETGRRR